MAVQPLTATRAITRQTHGYWWGVGRRLVRKKLAFASLVIILVLYGVGVFSSLVAPQGYTEQRLLEAKRGPSADHWLGTDRLGRDLFSRVVYALRTTVIVTVAGVASGTILIGVTLGALAGYFGRWVDTVVSRTGEVFAAFPDILLLILLTATLRPRILEWARGIEDATGIDGLIRSGAVDYLVVAFAFTAFSWYGMMRLVRGQVLSLRRQEFVEAARAVGVSTPAIIFRHLLPNFLGPVIVVVSAGLGAAAGSEVLLSWLGIGVQPPVPSLGRMIAENFGLGNLSLLRTTPHLILFPVGVVAVILFSFNLLGDGLTDAFNPRTR